MNEKENQRRIWQSLWEGDSDDLVFVGSPYETRQLIVAYDSGSVAYVDMAHFQKLRVPRNATVYEYGTPELERKMEELLASSRVQFVEVWR